ncbi:hypothetical protein MKW98_029335 [Papaver atlanticum]|uniref:Early nodulin-93-like n=2 Tax=Papaver TaxID=3468 RepID=A0A4Y7IVN5_PAPSO|nr:early nodulin-93-like [Papaver somniferum]KAI3908785.1 hypothetical protein MKW98_029335 [Papaver atlanticum]RZC51465.1 hypothetical protein C5167_019884 [Papaver somniferum]
MGITSDIKDSLLNKKQSILIPTSYEEQRILNSKRCTQEGVRAGTKAAVVAGIATAVPTLIAVRKVPWAKASLNYTAQALIISGASIAAYFITADKTILECARKNSREQYDNLKK